MRSALDHLAFDLVKRNHAGTPLPAKWINDAEFPLRLKAPVKASQSRVCHTLPAPYGVFSRELPNISVEAHTFIESTQPYYTNNVVSNSLRFLVELSNIDKHRYLHIIRPRTRQKQTVRYLSGLMGSSTTILDRGAQIETQTGWNKTDRAVYVHRRYKTIVALGERGVLGEAVVLPVEVLLKFILDSIKRSILPKMKQLIKAP